MGVLRIMSNTNEPDEKEYIEKALKMLMVTTYKSGTMDDGKFDFYVCLYDQDMSWLKRSIDHIYYTYEFSHYDYPKYQKNPEFLTDMNFYNQDEAFEGPIVAKYDRITILSDRCKEYNNDGSSIVGVFTPSDILYSFNYHKLMNAVLMLLESIGDDDKLQNVLIIGRDNNLYAKLLSLYVTEIKKSSIKIDNCDINEYGRYSNKTYDCVLVIPYMESIITNILHIRSSVYIVYGIYNNYRQIMHYGKQLSKINAFYKNNNLEYRTINSINWNGYVYGSFNLDRFDKVHGSCNLCVEGSH